MTPTAIKVAKFGGTSMGSARALWNAAQILAADPDARVVVVSATSGTTNKLLAFAAVEFAGERAAGDQLLTEIMERHELLAKELGVAVAAFPVLFKELRDLQGMLRDAQASGVRQQPRILDQVLSIGERLSSELFAAVLRVEGRDAISFDVRRVLRTDATYGKAEPDLRAIQALTQEHLALELAQRELIVTQGFIGSAPGGSTTTLGRGGSDYSAALLGEALRAESVYIWTDVPGVFTMDPGVVPEAKPIAELSFSEAAELANFGAKVLHPATLLPAMRAGIPVFVGSTFHAQDGGTWVKRSCEEAPLVRAVAMRKKQTLITVTSLRMLNAQGFLAKLFQTLAEHCLTVDIVTTSEVSVALTLDGASFGSGGGTILDNHLLLEELRSFSEVSVEEDLTLVAVIGNRLTSTAGVAARAFAAVEPDNIRLLCHGASQHNLCLLVQSANAAGIAQRLHHEFLGA